MENSVTINKILDNRGSNNFLFQKGPTLIHSTQGETL